MVYEEANPSTSLSLLGRVQRRDEEAWQLLVGLYAPMIYSRCRQDWNLPATHAENVGQDVFAAVVKSIGKFDRQRTGSFRKWLRIITDNKCKDFIRKLKDAEPAGGTNAQKALENIADETVLPDETEVDEREKTLLVRQALTMIESEVSKRDLDIFLSIVVDERNRQDVAASNGVTDNVVYIVCSRITKRLREIFEDLMDDDLFGSTDLNPN